MPCPDRICYRPGVWCSQAPRARLRNPDGVDPDSDARLGNPDGVALDSDACSVSSGGGVPTPCTRRRFPLRHSIFSGYPTSGILSGWRSIFSGYPTFGILSGWRSTFSEYFTSGRHIRMGKEGISTSPVRHVRILW